MQQSHDSRLESFWVPLGTCTFARYQEPRTRYLVPGAWYQVPGTSCTRYLLPGTWYQAPGTRYQVPGTWYLVPGTRYQVPGTRYLVPGTWYPLGRLGPPPSNFKLNVHRLRCLSTKSSLLEHATGATGAAGAAGTTEVVSRTAARSPPPTRAGGQDDGSYTNSLK